MNSSISVILPQSLEQRRDEFTGYITAGHAIVQEFAKKSGWESYMQKPFMKSAGIFDEKPLFDEQIEALFGVPAASVPATYSAMLEFEHFYAVSPELYIANFPQGREPQFYEKLIAHEIAHRLHVRILEGNEDAMGPVWFYEGFATTAAGQFSEMNLSISPEEIRIVTGETERGDYRTYHKIIAYLTQKYSISELVYKVWDNDFSFLETI